MYHCLQDLFWSQMKTDMWKRNIIHIAVYLAAAQILEFFQRHLLVEDIISSSKVTNLLKKRQNQSVLEIYFLLMFKHFITAY
nr:unnamed protein product [Callosobruchus analis]